MKLNLKKDLVFFDLETTGLSMADDRIVQIAIIKHFADGREPIEKCRLVNPMIPIPKAASDIHNITDEMVKDEPTFAKIAKAFSEFIGDADIAGYNSDKFDIPMLLEEFDRAGVEFDMSERKFVDVYKIFQKFERRDLEAAYQFYCGKKAENAHDALYDTRMTSEVLLAQIQKYEGLDCENKDGSVDVAPVKNDINALSEFTMNKDRLDYSSKMVLNEDGVAVFNFGKHKGEPVSKVVASNPGYYDWFMKSDFTSNSKKVLKELVGK